VDVPQRGRTGRLPERGHRLQVFLSIRIPGTDPWDQDALTTLSRRSLAERVAGGSPWAEARPGERSRGFPPPSLRRRVQKRAGGEEAGGGGGPPLCVPPTASPPRRLREKRPRAPGLSVGRAERGGRRRRCGSGGHFGRSGPLCWRWGRWRASASQVSGAPAPRAEALLGPAQPPNLQTQAG
jgi:hypothetical protein